MTKLNFKKFSKYTGINRKQKKTGDTREEFADLVYCHAGGIKAHALAFKIRDSSGKEEYNEEEVAIIRYIAEKYCLPGFIDGLHEQLNIKPEVKEE